jgi:PBSX family phage terminase large subunit
MQEQFELTKKQAEYIREAHHRWNISCGAVRSGKSYLQISYVIPTRLMERQGKRGLRVILGATRENIERNILAPMRDIYGDAVATEINSKNYAKILGEKVYCIGADKVSQVAKIRGSEIAYVAIDEATDINKEVFEMLKSRLSLPWSCCDATTNPASPNHWFKSFLDSAEQGVDIYCQDYTIYDNPFLPEEYVRALESEYDGVWYDRYILGKWTLAEGLVYPNHDLCLYEDPFIPADMDPAEDYFVSLDYGTSNPFAALRWEKRGDVWYAPKELYYSGRDTGIQKTDAEYLKMLEDFCSDIIAQFREHPEINAWGEKIYKLIPVIVDPSAASFIALLKQSPYFKPQSANNDVLNGIRETSTAISTGKIKVHRTCKNCLKEFQSYVWDEDAETDRPVKEYDHLMDAMRYFVKTKRIVKPSSPYNSILGG